MDDPQGLKSPQRTNHSMPYDKSFAFSNLTRFPPIEKLSNYESISFEGNPISSFKTLPKLASLRKMCLDNTKITSFMDCPTEPKLSSVSFFNTPIEKYENLSLMCIISLGNRIRRVNGKSLTAEEINFANETRSILKPYLKRGYILKSIDPPVLINYYTNEKKTFTRQKKKNVQQNIPQSPMNVYQNSLNILKRDKRMHNQKRNKSTDVKKIMSARNVKQPKGVIKTQLPFIDDNEPLLTDEMLLPERLKRPIRSKSIPKPPKKEILNGNKEKQQKSPMHKRPPPLSINQEISDHENEEKIVQIQREEKEINEQKIDNSKAQNQSANSQQQNEKQEKSKQRTPKIHKTRKHRNSQKQQLQKENEQQAPPPLKIPDQGEVFNISKQLEIEEKPKIEEIGKQVKKKSKQRPKKNKQIPQNIPNIIQNRELIHENIGNQPEIDLSHESISVFGERRKQKRKRSNKVSNQIQNTPQGQLPGIYDFGSITITQCPDSSDSEDPFKKTFSTKPRKPFLPHQKPQKSPYRDHNNSKLQNQQKITISNDFGHSYSTEFKITGSNSNLSAIKQTKVLPQMQFPEESGMHSLNFEDIIQPPKGAYQQKIIGGKPKESDEESLSLTVGTLFSTLDVLSPRNKNKKRHTKAPKLSFDPPPITYDEDTPTSFNGKITREDAYRAFYMTHKNEISTPDEIERFIYNYMKKMNRKK